MTDRLSWSFRRGDWYAVLGVHATVLLPPSEKARVARIWELVDDGAGFDETLDALISDGLRDLPAFVVVAESEAGTTVVVRGPGQVHLASGDDVVHVTGDDASTWVERTVADVSRIRVEVAEDADGGDGVDRVLETGLVRVASVEHPPAGADDLEPAVVEPEPEPATEPEAAADPEPEDEPEVSDHDGLTHAGPDDGGPVRPLPGIPGQEPAPPVTARPVGRLVLSTGETIDVDRPVLVGRAPVADRSGEGEPLLVPVASPQQEISATHLEIRPGSGADHGAAVVTDLGSTNGTVVRQPGLPPDELRPGVAVQLIPGAVVDLGDGLTIKVVDV